MKKAESNKGHSLKFFSAFIIGYIIFVLTLDFLISMEVEIPLNFTVLRISISDVFYKMGNVRYSAHFNCLSHFDILKFLTWFMIPLLLFQKRIDLKWLSIAKLGKPDLCILMVFSAVCILSLGMIFILPSLRNYYSGLGALPKEAKIIFFLQQVFWIISWLPGWELLNRHLLLKESEALYPDKGWLLVPAVETLYHLSKPIPEAVGMFIFSILATFYTKKRRNNIPAFMCHLAIEIGLITLLLIV
ncbi:MAG: hypothetical protein N3G21_02785 [Candidatus Hydrogenedentes bacterium]|nr:hypothetical protein [Candidatus Hydrogenedentota bacterium]